MDFVYIGLGVFGLLVIVVVVDRFSFAHRRRTEDMKEENAHRDFGENNPRAGQDSFKHRLK